MICRACQHDNPDLSVFCSQCGLQIKSGQTLECGRCGTRNTIESRFCYRCGAELVSGDKPGDGSLPAPADHSVARLVERILAEKQALAARGVPEGERKTVTALFSDIKGSTDMMQDLDPDEARTIVDPALRLMIDAVEQHDGYVVQSQGDGVFALFGAPIANEDHALQAIRAAVSMQENIAAYRDQLTAQGKPQLQIRVGLNTGEMVLRSIPRGDLQLEYNAIGHAVNLAARIQTFASPGGIGVGEETFKLAEGYFEFRSIGRKEVKGVREPVEIREIMGVGRLRSRFELAESRGLLPLVGRGDELAAMTGAMRKVLGGHGQVVAVAGEPGVGKSRLFHEFKRTLGPEWRLFETSSISHAKPFPYVPLRDLLKRYFELVPEDRDNVRRQKVLDRSLSIDSSLAEAVPYLCSLLGISGPEDAKLQQSGPEVRQQLMLDATERLLAAESARSPLAIIFEDMHWMDDKTEEFLVAFGQHLAAYQILLLVNYRPEYHNRWKDYDNFTEINLKPLKSTDTQTLLSSMLGDGPNLVSVKTLIAGLTEGNPFFAEELVRDLLDKGLLRQGDSGVSAVPDLADRLNALKVPTTLQGVLASRIDALAPSYKELLQRLSIFGREFPLRLVQPFAGRAEGELKRELEQLEQSGFVYSEGSAETAEFKFKHSLTQQVAYNSMPVERRKVMHERAGKAIEDVFANRLQDHYAELAYHYSRSTNLDKAIDYLGNAGNQAVFMAAHRQAIGQFEDGLNLLKSLPVSPTREAKELKLRFSLAAALWQSEGPANQELQGQLKRVLQLVKPETDPFLSFGVLQSSVLLSWINADYAEALRRCERLTSFAEQVNLPVTTMLALFMRSTVLMLTGELTLARRDFEEAFALYEPLHSVLPKDASNIAMQAFALYGPSLCILGYPDRATQVSDDSIAAAASRSTKYYLAYVTYFAGFVRLMRGDVAAAQQRADEAITIASEIGFPSVLGGAKVLRGWSLADTGKFDESIKMIREGIDEFERSTGKVWHATLNGILLEVLISAGRLEEAAILVQENIQFADAFGERVTLAELWRAKGNICLAGKVNDQIEAEKCFRRALRIAKEQSARFFELRAAKNLASLLRDTGRREEARSILTEIYQAFTEGFETSDLKEAKVLLSQLDLLGQEEPEN
jgi:class 3 adenylate cyclase/tetratricopeptide (TPR) repeat protein